MPAPLADALRYTSKPLSQNVWELFTRLPLHWALRWVSPCEPFKGCFSVPYSLVGLVDTSPFGFQNLVFRGLVSQVQVLKVGVPDVRFKPFSPQGEAQVCKFPLSCWSWHQVGVYGKIVPQLLLPTSMWDFSHLPRVSQLDFGILFRGNFSICSCRFGISKGRREFRTLLCHHPEPDSYLYFFSLFLLASLVG